MRAGRMRHKVILQQPAISRESSYGDPSETWTTVTSAWAEVEPLSGSELFRARQVQSDVTHRVSMRHRHGVAARMRFLAPRGQTVVSGDITATSVSVTVANAAPFPSRVPFAALLGNEIVRVAAGEARTTTWTIARAQDGTSAAPHGTGRAVTLMVPLEIEAPMDVGGRGRELELLCVERNG